MVDLTRTQLATLRHFGAKQRLPNRQAYSQQKNPLKAGFVGNGGPDRTQLATLRHFGAKQRLPNRQAYSKQKTRSRRVLSEMVDLTRIELATSCMPCRRSPS